MHVLSEIDVLLSLPHATTAFSGHWLKSGFIIGRVLRFLSRLREHAVPICARLTHDNKADLDLMVAPRHSTSCDENESTRFRLGCGRIYQNVGQDRTIRYVRTHAEERIARRRMTDVNQPKHLLDHIQASASKIAPCSCLICRHIPYFFNIWKANNATGRGRSSTANLIDYVSTIIGRVTWLLIVPASTKPTKATGTRSICPKTSTWARRAGEKSNVQCPTLMLGFLGFDRKGSAHERARHRNQWRGTHREVKRVTWRLSGTITGFIALFCHPLLVSKNNSSRGELRKCSVCSEMRV
jgi:hypothetical protein